MKRSSISLMAVALAAVVAFAPTLAYAGSPFGGGKGIRTPRIGNVMGGGRHGGPNLSGLSRGIGRSNGFSGLSRGLSGLGGSNLGRLGSSNRNHWNNNGSNGVFGGHNNLSGFGGFGRGYGSGWGGYGSGWGGYYDHGHDDFADAYRDVGIATAAVGLVGILTNAAMAADYRCAAPAPVPVAVAAPAPAGYWARQAVVVQPERYEQYQEWIPELYDLRTGQKIGGGYYESRTRLVPQVVEHRDVWVTR